jgi:MoaA/NifB/PqqE/SkfB family radical SAM enzyme
METVILENRLSDRSNQNKTLAEEEFEQRKVELRSFPQMLAVYTTDACNLRCIGCHFGKRIAPPLSISPEGYQRALDVFPYVKEIGIAGGEMFFDSGNPKGYVQKFFSEAGKYPDLRFIGFTNGTLLTPERIRLIVDRFNWIGISIDSPYPDVYKTIRVGAELNHVRANIEKIAELKAQRGLGRTDNPKIVLSSVIIELTYKGILDLVKLGNDVGAARIHLLEPWVGTYEEEYIFRDPERTLEYLSLRKEAFKKARDLGIKIQDRTRNAITNHLPSLEKNLDFSEDELVSQWPHCCNAPWSELYIWRNGEARICCTSSTVIGNINDNSISEIWNSRVAMKVRRRILKGNYKKDCQDNCHRGYVLPHCHKQGLFHRVRGLFQIK